MNIKCYTEISPFVVVKFKIINFCFDAHLVVNYCTYMSKQATENLVQVIQNELKFVQKSL